MPKGKSTRKLKLFEQGRANLEKILGSSVEGYHCPLCGELKLLGELTLEHVPPKSMNGKEIILTCDKCNNDSGTKIDSHIARQQNMNRVLSGLANKKFKQKERARLVFNGIKLSVDIVKDKEDSPLYFQILGHENPLDIQKLKDNIRDATTNSASFGFQLQGAERYAYNERLANIGHLKTAFLALSAALGYAFAFNERIAIFRKQILSPNDELADFYLEYYPTENSARRIVVAIQLGIIVVSFDGVRVLLPHPARMLESYYETIEAIRAGKLPNIRGIEIPWPNSFEASLDNSTYYSFKIINEQMS